MKINSKDNKPGIYVIRNTLSNKVYVGKSKNIYKRLYQHLYDLKTENRHFNENPYLLRSVLKNGIDKFDYYVIEYLDIDLENLEELLAERELFWIKSLNSLNRNKGYNLRYDSEGKCFVSDETKEKISKRMKKEWKSGIRNDHSIKLKEYWEENADRKLNQSKIMSKNKTKYYYIIYDENNNLITNNGNYALLKQLGLTNAPTQFSRKKSDEVICKKHKVIRKLIK